MSEKEIILTTLFCLLLFALIYITYRILKNPYKFPYFNYSFDITGKRKVNIEDCIDNFLLNNNNWHRILSHQHKIEQWKIQTEKEIQNSPLKKYRLKQYKSVLDDKYAYHFNIIRKQTRYQQRNYIKTSYKVSITDSMWAVSWLWLYSRHTRLESIGFETTLKDYNSKNQRKLMTPTLRRKIMERDNFTCQICGKYMPDEVGLHIDHIIPIAKGGKSVPTNLRVLCSKCNGRKGAK